MTVKRLAKLYDTLYDKADKLFKEHDLCAITESGCGGGQWGSCPCSCYKCRYFGSDGCTVRMLGCKLRYCYIIEKVAKFDPTLKKLDKMERVMKRYGIWGSDTKEQLVERLNRGTKR